MRIAVLLGISIAATFITSSCATNSRVAGPSTGIEAFSEDDEKCGTANAIAENVVLRVVDHKKNSSTVSSLLLRLVKNEILSIDNVRYVSGRCAARLSGFEATNLYFGKVVGLSGFDGRLKVVTPPLGTPTKGFNTIKKSEGPANWKGEQFLMASLLGQKKVGEGFTPLYVGVWGTKNRSYVGVFEQKPSGLFSEPALLATSNIPIRSVSYFPSYDSPSGKLGLLQESLHGLRLVNVNWMHPDL
jgi:hypothetical protein